MALSVWTQPTGYTIGTFQERIKFDQQLPVSSDVGVTYSVISGKLPDGLRIEHDRIIGTPNEVARETSFAFCVRASRNIEIADRTFIIIIQGADEPTFTTLAGYLDIGLYKQFFVLDSTYIEYQIEAFDTDTAIGQQLSYFIADGDGELPPGLVLTDDGRIVGLIEPVISIKPEDGSGFYDSGFYDVIAYDFGYRSTNGYDSYIYDNVEFDYSLPSFRPKKLNRKYEFTITVTDGDSFSQRTFGIFVVGDDYFRADNNTLQLTMGIFTADVTYLRAPIWITSSNLGTFRANNYLVLFLDTYDKSKLVSYQVADAIEGWQPLHNYKINDLILVSDKSYICIVDHISGLSIDTTKWDKYGFPPGMAFDYNTADVYGRVPYQPAITETYRFTISAVRFSDLGDELAISTRTFVVRIVGEVDSVLTWISNSNLGSINANYVVNLKVEAESTVTNSLLLYRLTSGELPNGLTLSLDGEIIGSVNQLSDNEKEIVGLTTFDYNINTIFDGGDITFDRSNTFTIQVRDQYGYSASEKSFTINIDTPNQILYSNIRTRPFLKMAQRDIWKNFINDSSIFTSSSIYRLNDPNYGIQTELSMVIYAGLETLIPAAYIGAMGLNHKRKRFQFGSVKKATAIYPSSTNKLYEVVYVEMIDPLEPNNKRLANKVTRKRQTPAITMDNSTSIWSMTIQDLTNPAPFASRPIPNVTADGTGYAVSDSNATTYFPNSISNWRDRLKGAGETERNYLPLWMRSIQSGTKEELGFTLAVPLCFCKVGMADDIILNIKHSGFDFKVLDYTTDRYIIDSVIGDTNDRYLIFRNDRITI